MPNLTAVVRYGSRLTIGGLAIVLLCASVQPLSAGPFNMFKSRSSQGQPATQGSAGGNGGLSAVYSTAARGILSLKGR